MPPVASWSPPHFRVLQSNTTLLKVKLHWCPNYIGVLAGMLLLASRSLRLGLLEDNKTSLQLKQNWCPCAGTSGCFSVTTLGAPERQGSMAVCPRALQNNTKWLKVKQRWCPCTGISGCFSVTTTLTGPAINTTLLKVKLNWCPCTRASACFWVTSFRSPARQGNVAQGQTSFVSLHKCPDLLLGHHQHFQALQQNTTLLKVKLRRCPCTGASGCFSVTALRVPERQGSMAQGQTSFVSLYGCFLFLLGHCI